MTSPDDTDITIWGPANSGKDWLFRGFAKELEEYTLRSEDFIFDLVKTGRGNQKSNKVLVELPHNIHHTASVEEDYIYAFQEKQNRITNMSIIK